MDEVGRDVTFCYRHGDRRAGVVCQRCDRPICPECMTRADVGFHCPECTRSGSRRVLQGARAFAPARPIVTQVLIAVNVAVFLGAAVLSRSLGGLSFEVLVDGGLVGGGLVEVGGRVFQVPGTGGVDFASLPGAVGVDAGQWWRIVTSAFLHDGLLHLGLNMAALWILGSQLERALGPVRYVALYGASLLAGSLGVLLVSPTTLTVGASGAVFGLMGAALAVQRASGIDPFSSGIGTLIAVNLLFTFAVPNISIGGHVGGLVGGLVVGALLVESIRRRWPAPVTAAAVAALAAGFAVGAVVAAGTWTDPLL